MTARARGEDRRDDLARPRTSWALWFAVLGGPAAGLVNVGLGYTAVDRACVSNSSIILHLLSIVFLALAVIAGMTAWRLRNAAGDWPLTSGGMLPRTRFLANLGLLTSAIAIVGILMQWIPVFFFGACQGS
ncbi:MAG: hypothetical protein ACJ77T_10065 [Gemmatimonadaceae bacterium]